MVNPPALQSNQGAELSITTTKAAGAGDNAFRMDRYDHSYANEQITRKQTHLPASQNGTQQRSMYLPLRGVYASDRTRAYFHAAVSFSTMRYHTYQQHQPQSCAEGDLQT
jgi:hypothetical protein